jgi:hypothetical protein
LWGAGDFGNNARMNLQQIRKALSGERNQLGARRAKVQTAVKALGGVRVGPGQVSTKSAAIMRKPKFIRAEGAKMKAASAGKAVL